MRVYRGLSYCNQCAQVVMNQVEAGKTQGQIANLRRSGNWDIYPQRRDESIPQNRPIHCVNGPDCLSSPGELGALVTDVLTEEGLRWVASQIAGPAEDWVTERHLVRWYRKWQTELSNRQPAEFRNLRAARNWARIRHKVENVKLYVVGIPGYHDGWEIVSPIEMAADDDQDEDTDHVELRATMENGDETVELPDRRNRLKIVRVRGRR